ncbi:hypothetical protein BDR05DRAFT_999734 [Suillus weaverae]|nr:hypothetical protein BDR05DRAFT_999734 [Suillus weaverae]
MAPIEHSKTVDFGIKLALLMSAPHVSDVPTLDKLTDLELNHLIVEEEEPADAVQPLSHMLTQIFRTFTLEVPDATELQVPLHKIRYRDTRLHNKLAHLNEHSMVPLYDKENCRWNWALPKSHCESGIIQLPDLEEGGDREENSGANKESGSGGTSGGEGPAEVSTTSSDTSPKPHTLEDIFSSFFNTTCGAVAQEKPNEVMVANSGAVVCTWSAHNSTCPVKDQEVSRKPDLVLLDDVEARWDTIKAVCKLTSQLYTTTGTIGKTIDSKAYLLLRRQPWRQFVLLFSLTHKYRELRVHMYDHAGGVVMPPIHIDNFPNDFLHILSSVVFGSLECIGYNPSISIFMKMLRPAQLKNPTSCPSTSKQPTRDQVSSFQTEGPVEGTGPKMIIDTPESDSEIDLDAEIEESLPRDPPQLDIPQDPLHTTFSDPIGRIIVNDHAYNTLEVIFSSQGLVGCGTVCYLARRDDEEYIIKDHWVLRSKDAVLNEVEMLQEMQGVHGVPELVEYWLVEITPNEVDEIMNYWYKVFGSIKGTSCTHFNSLNDAMIEDDGDGTNGMLINLEFAVHMHADQKYTIGGTGTLPFMSHSLLWQLSEAVGNVVTSARSWKAKVATSSLAKPPLILHHYHDDLESLFYVFVCICIEFRGPLGVRRNLSAERSQEQRYEDFVFFHPNTDKLKKQFHPYFKTLLPLATQWYNLIRNKGPSSVVTFQEVLHLVEAQLAKLPKDEPSPELLFAKKVIAALLKKRHTSDFEGDDGIDHLNKPSIIERGMIQGRKGWMMEVTPQPKRSKTT